MSETKLLLDVIGNLRNLADSVQAFADAMCESDTPVEASEKSATTHTSTQPSVSLEEVRAALAEKSRLGFTEQVRALLIQHGADKLSEIDPGEYESLLRNAEVIGNG